MQVISVQWTGMFPSGDWLGHCDSDSVENIAWVKSRLAVTSEAELAAVKMHGLHSSPLLLAAHHDAEEITTLLLNAKANVHTPSRKDGRTPLSVASSAGSHKVAKLLIKVSSPRAAAACRCA